MEETKKSSIIKEALVDYNAIVEAADVNAKKKLAEKFPESFQEILKEEIKNKNKAKESYKKIDDVEESEKSDENESKNESDMKKEVKETVKVVDTVGKGKPFEKNVEEDVKINPKGGHPTITNTIGKGNPYAVKKSGSQKIEEEREKEFMADVESDTPNQAKGDTKKGIAFKEKLKQPTSGKSIANLKEEFDISELDMENVEEALDGANNDSEIITFDEIEEEISRMEGLEEEIEGMSGLPRPEFQPRGKAAGQGGDAFNQLISMKNQLDEIIKNLGGVEEMTTEEVGLESDEMITDDDIDAVLGSKEESVEEGYGMEEEGYGMEKEGMEEEGYGREEEGYGREEEGFGREEESIEETKGISYSDGTITPGKLGDHQGTHGRFRQQQNESIRLGRLMEENKNLTKKLNEQKKQKESLTSLVENYKSALEKYRNQLKEMAIFNTNLAHVNNLLVNESLALTQDDKIKIINEFKKVGSISESQKIYKNFLSEMKESKRTISESIENRVSASIQPSSKQKLDEVVEKTAYANDKHIQKMKNLIEYVENRGKKIIK